MATALKIQTNDKYVTVDGLKTRYLEEGHGPALLLLHGASLGSSADVFIRNMPGLAKAGFRVIAFDSPGFGLTDNPTDHSAAFRRNFIPKFLDALGLKTVGIIAHSQAGGTAVQLALADPSRYSHILVLGTGSLLPPLDAKKGGETREAAAQQRLERRMAVSEPTIADTRKLLEANLFHHELITEDELALRHERSIGKNFESFVARQEAAESAPKKEPAKPLWERLTDLQQVKLRLIFGKNDRANAFERATMLKELRPQLDLHIIDDCKHLVPWDRADEVQRLGVPFFKS